MQIGLSLLKLRPELADSLFRDAKRLSILVSLPLEESRGPFARFLPGKRGA